MATIITEECINCGACEPECPNTAIYQAGVEYEQEGKKHGALSDDFFYIVGDKCTECVGFFEYEACAAVCPVDCCVTDPERQEEESTLIARARQLHPDEDLSGEYPSRFRAGGKEGGKKEAQAAAEKEEAAGAKAEPAALTPAAASPATAVAAPAGTPLVEKATAKPERKVRAGDPARDLQGELGEPFEEVLAEACRQDKRGVGIVAGIGLVAAMPLLGALDHETKQAIEAACGNKRYFSAQLATAVNIFLNFLLYPVLGYAVGLLAGMTPLTEADRSWIIMGVLAAVAETVVRLRQGIFGFLPAARMSYGASMYGAPLSVLIGPIIRKLLRRTRSGWVPVEGYYKGQFEPKREREKRYGEVYTVEELAGGYYVRFELPLEIPSSAARRELGIADEMPDYDIRIGLDTTVLTVRGSVVDPELRALCGILPAFPSQFRTEIPLAAPAGGFRHRYGDKTLEIVVLKQER